MRSITHYIANLPGWRTNRKIVVFESDDWGSIRMPSLEAFNKLKNAGLHPGRGRYNRFDSLECNKDLESLFKVIDSFKDKNGNHPAITALCVVANPDFERIRADEFRNYYPEPLPETLGRFPARNRVLDLWKEGVEKRLFIPQFHGREHLNVQRWLRDLKAGNWDTMLAFHNRLWGVSSDQIGDGYQAAFDLDLPGDLDYHKTVIEEGLDLFEQILGYRASYFVPSNGPFNLSLEKTLHENGIKYITLDKRQKEPLGDGKYRTHYRYLGKKNRYGQLYLSRNAAFEPSDNNTGWVERCLKRIEIAFRMKKPAVVSTHRVNFIGSLDPLNRKRGLGHLSGLLKATLKKWPEVEFLTSAELGELISGGGND